VHLGMVDDFYASFEWSDGGILHAHIAFWIVGSPRIDKIQIPKEIDNDDDDADDLDDVVEIDVTAEDKTVLTHDQAASLLASFWDPVLTEYNVAKAARAHATAVGCQPNPASYSATHAVSAHGDLCQDTGPRQKLGKKSEREKPSPESLSYEALTHCLLNREPLTWTHGNGGIRFSDKEKAEAEKACWDELHHILEECGRVQPPANWKQAESECAATARSASDITAADISISDISNADISHADTSTCDAPSAIIPRSQALPATQEQRDQQRAYARKLFVAALAEWVNMHDLHRPFALGPPSKDQPCAAVDNEH